MRSHKYILILICVQAISLNAFAQNLELDELLRHVKQYHPVVMQAELAVEGGLANVMKERGDLDPELYGNIDHKDFQGTQYFEQNEAGIKIPTLTGVELNSSYNTNRGALLNPEMYTPGGGVVSGGISVPLGRGLLTDEDRASLKKAKIYAQATKLEQQTMLNDILFNCIRQYYKWAEAYKQYRVYDYSVTLAGDRFTAVKRSHELGDLPAIDTLESYIQLQNRTLLRAEYELKYLKETRLLSNYIWGDSLTPLRLADTTLPADLELMQLPNPVDPTGLRVLEVNLVQQHPDIKKFDLQKEQLLVDRKLHVEFLKPQLDVHYNILNEPIQGDPFTGLNTNNYKWGLDFSFPLYLRKSRASIQLTDIYIQDNRIEQSAKLLELQNKMQQFVNMQNILLEQIANYRDAVRNYDRMLQAERQKFAAGESSLFLINSRENMLFTARLKLIELLSNYNSAHYGIYWSAGVIGQDDWSDFMQ